MKYHCYLSALLTLSPAIAAEIRIPSPNGRLHGIISTDASGHLTWSVTANGTPVVLPSAIGITVDSQDLGQAAQLGKVTPRAIKETYPMLGAHPLARNFCREGVIPVTSGDDKTAWTLEVRAYDDGIAYRYRVPGERGERTINGESSSWTFPEGGKIWFQDSGSRDYERGFEAGSPDSLSQDRTIMSDCTIQLPGDLGYVMPTEANVVDYSDMILQTNGPSRFKAKFPHDGNGWKQKGEIVSPWRVTIYSADLNGLVNCDILRNLCPPPSPELAKADWIIPGRANWHWMVVGKPMIEDQRKWIDWTRDLGWEYYIIDDGWVEWKGNGKDQWALMKETVAYAATQKVKIIAWVHTKEVTEPAARLAYFKKAREAGLAGLKIDFMGEPNAFWMHWYDETLRDAAAARLLVNFHGCVKPSGRERTWPNELTREGIRGRENGRQSGTHPTALPFTRYVQGHADFTPTDWRGDKLNGGSYASELAQAVVFTSPLLCYSGDPANYLKNEAAEVLKALPATWDETIVLPGSAIGEVAAFARRKGREWFVGVVNNGNARTLTIPLEFLGAGTWRGEQWGDDENKNDAWKRQTKSVTSSESITAVMRGDGGFVAHFTR